MTAILCFGAVIVWQIINPNSETMTFYSMVSMLGYYLAWIMVMQTRACTCTSWGRNYAECQSLMAHGHKTAKISLFQGWATRRQLCVCWGAGRVLIGVWVYWHPMAACWHRVCFEIRGVVAIYERAQNHTSDTRARERGEHAQVFKAPQGVSRK